MQTKTTPQCDLAPLVSVMPEKYRECSQLVAAAGTLVRLAREVGQLRAQYDRARQELVDLAQAVADPAIREATGAPARARRSHSGSVCPECHGTMMVRTQAQIVRNMPGRQCTRCAIVHSYGEPGNTMPLLQVLGRVFDGEVA